MAVYELKNIRQVPARYTSSTGSLANHETKEEDLAVDASGNLESTFQQTFANQIAFTDAADFDSLDEEQQRRAVYSPFPAFFGEQERFGAVAELGSDKAEQDNRLEVQDDFLVPNELQPQQEADVSASAASQVEDANETLEGGDETQQTPPKRKSSGKKN